MTAQKDLEITGNLSAYPFAELIVEILHSELDGSLRLSSGDRKVMVYFRDGKIVYVVSNSKALRLFNVLLRSGIIDTKIIARHPNFANDSEFAGNLTSTGILAQKTLDEAFTSQMNDIIVEVLTWPEGEWKFDPLIRAKAELKYPIDCHAILIDYARCASAERIYTRFKSVTETFALVPEPPTGLDLQAHEAFVLDQFGMEAYSIEEIRRQCNLPEGGILQALYVLWLGGLLVRREWNAAFTPAKVAAMQHLRIEKVRDAIGINTPESEKPEVAADEAAPEPEVAKLPETLLTLDQYLKQIESAETHYDALGIAASADSAAIKSAYFSLAKMFHPDRFHRESEAKLKRIQTAFTIMAHAHEVLKAPESREPYNAKMYKEIEAREKRRAAGQPDVDPTDKKGEEGLHNFEEGLSMINEEEYEAAAAYLARAVHYSPQNALYHAYFGVALYYADDKHRHKAESEFQAAIKLEPKNVKIRMMFVDFLIDQRMAKRAEGELNRFLEIVPGNKEAMSALAKLGQ